MADGNTKRSWRPMNGDVGGKGVLTIETARLRLRRHRPDDLAARTAMTGDPAVMRFIGGVLQGEEENWHRLLRYAGHWALFGHGLFAIEERASGRFAGEAGVAEFHRGLGADFDRVPEAAWMLASWATGRGYAREAMEAALAWHAARFGLPRAVCLIAPEHARSLRLAAALGFRSFAERLYHDRPVILHERLEDPPAPR